MSISSAVRAPLLVVALLFPAVALSHPGRTDSYGCHNETATGTYHCHSGKFEGRSFPSKDAMLIEWANTVWTPIDSSNPPTIPPQTGGVSQPTIPYDRALYRHWVDADGDCQDTRQEVLIVESIIPVTLSPDGCRVTAGAWFDPYTGNTYTDPSVLDVDHMIPLENAHNSGGYAWDTDRKRSFANDLALSKSLIAVSASANRSKGSRGPAEWLPPNQAYHCEYVKDWLEVKRRHALAVGSADYQAIEAVIGTSLAFAARDESWGWDEIEGRPSSAVFGLGIRRVDECAYTRQASPTDEIVVTVSVLPDAAHLNQAFVIHLVADIEGSLFNINSRGQFSPFYGELGTLAPFKDAMFLKQSHEFTAFSGVLNDTLIMNLYVGYSTESGDFVYTKEPIPFVIAPASVAP